MSGKKTAFIYTIFHSIADSIEENVLLKFNEAKYLFWLNLTIGIFVLGMSLFNSLEMSLISFGVIILYTFAIVGGDFCYVKAIQTLPIGLANLVDSGSLFLILLCDIFLGYIKPKLIFLVLFVIFFIAIYVFSYETNKMKNEITTKKIDLKNIFILITSTIFYASEPYFLKLATSKGANEFGINLIYYIIAIPIYYVLYLKEKKEGLVEEFAPGDKKKFIFNIILLAVIYAITSILSIIAYNNGTPVLINLIMHLQLFIVVIISVIRKTDKMNFKKIISLVVGVICIAIMTLIS